MWKKILNLLSENVLNKLLICITKVCSVLDKTLNNKQNKELDKAEKDLEYAINHGSLIDIQRAKDRLARIKGSKK